MQNVTLNVTGMSCGHCVNSIEGAVKELGAHAKVNLGEGTVAVEYDESKLTLEMVKQTIEEQGYSIV
ncbi:copper chaperone [Paenibacillus uliginis N3/975]|uniref:Copper chaperone n=1 Tax=Paenibacillus uliginis N3/975 TaxID=1313296 RepID=A0A1X7G8K6_9BACL|nr:cation transporter [Paenibacillus uliginis]SMF65143.1 copper chaperone [Paenibacillus uliginis N3/975]